MACCDTVEILTDLEIKAKGALHVERLQAGDWQAKGGSNPVNRVLEGMEIVNGRIEYGVSERLCYGIINPVLGN